MATGGESVTKRVQALRWASTSRGLNPPPKTGDHRTVTSLGRVVVCALTLTLGAGVGVGASITPSAAHALSCLGHESEKLELELRAIERDQEAVELELADEVLGTWMDRMVPDIDGELSLRDRERERFASFDLDTVIEPSAEVADYLERVANRKSEGELCGGQPLIPAEPGVYALSNHSSAGSLPDDTLLTIDAERREVVVEFDDEGTETVVRYEIVDFYFPSHRSDGCSVAGSSPSGPGGLAWGLGLLALCAWRRRAD